MKKIITPVILLLFSVFANGQQAFTNNGNLQIHPGGAVSGLGNFTNTSSGALVNNGSLYIAGTVTNDQASMAIGTGTLYLNGSVAQVVNGTQPFKTWHLNTNNTGGITLNNNLSVSGVHTFTNGMVITSSTPNYLIYEAGSSYTGDGDTRHVNGWVKKIGTTNFIFPVGNATYERTIALNSLSISGEFNVKYLNTTPNSYSYQVPVWDVNESEYWSIGKITGGSATVAMNWNNSKVYFPNWIVSDILVAGYNGTLWTNNGGAGTASGTAATTGTVNSSSISSFNLFALGSRSFILPLRLVNFTATRPGNYTLIGWKTANEYNMDHYTVERSDDGTSFYPIAQQAPRNSGNTEQYDSRDYAPIQHIAYYRLRFKEVNGHENLSNIIAVTTATGNNLTLLANPVHDKVILIATLSLNGVFNYTITAINGQLTQQGKLSIQNGGSYEFGLKGNIIPGTYTLEVSNGLESFRYKLTVQ
jgi:hypothetical protein